MRSIIFLVLFVVVFSVSCESEKKVNVLLILTDTTRADHLSCYGYERNTTPHIDSLVAAGTIAEWCQAQSSWTLPTMTTILSGVNTVTHGAGRSSSGFHGISPDVPWLPLAFHRAGYRTAAFFNVMFMNEDFGFHKGFQHFDCQGVASGNSLRKAGPTVDDFLGWLDNGSSDEPFFAAVHFYDPHIPYKAPEPFRYMYSNPDYSGEYGVDWGDMTEMIAINSGDVIPTEADIQNLIDLYDAEITYMDSEIGRMLEELRIRGLAENTLIVLVGDHGEEFMEHDGIEHGRTLYQEMTHVPLILAGPGFNGGNRISESVGQLDIAGTIANQTGIEFTSIEPAINLSEAINSEREIPASGVLWRPEGDIVSIVANQNKIIWSVEDDSIESFSLLEDPFEQNIILPPMSGLLEAAEFYWVTPPMGEAPLVDYSETASRELRNLGYIR